MRSGYRHTVIVLLHGIHVFSLIMTHQQFKHVEKHNVEVLECQKNNLNDTLTIKQAKIYTMKATQKAKNRVFDYLYAELRI